MSGSPVTPETEEFAALVAVEIDRTRAAIIDGMRTRLMAARLPQRIGLSPAGMQLLPFVRNMLPDRVIDADALRACERYIPQSTYDAAVAELVAAGVVEIGGTTVRLTSPGRDVAREMHDGLVAEVDDRWGRDTDLSGVELLTQRSLDAAALTGGLSFSVMNPPYDPPTSTSGSRCAERLNCLRVHRGDAHAGAWAAAGLTAEQMQDLGPGPERDAIERETNLRAAGPYEVLDPDDRRFLLEALRSLPG